MPRSLEASLGRPDELQTQAGNHNHRDARVGVKYKIFLAVLSGSGFASLLVLLLNAPVPVLPEFSSALLLPGAIPVALLSKSQEFEPPLAVLAANALIYSIASYVVVSVAWGKATVETRRLAAIRLMAPVAILIGLSCVPALNPLWPRGLAELASRESELQQALPLDMGLDGARNVLQAKGIQFHEDTETGKTVVLNDGRGLSITAAPGDHVVSARLQTEARAFPCGYDIQIVLLFGPNERMRQQYVHRFPICP
jgi:hypothetical protein